MNCTYVRQLSDGEPYEHFQRHEELSEGIDKLEHYKNIAIFTNPTDQEAIFYVHSVGYEVAEQKKNDTNILHHLQTVFHFVFSGEGSFNGHTVKRGDCFIAVQGEPYSISARGERGFTYGWITLTHPASFSISALGLDPQKTLFRCGFEAELRQTIYTMQSFSAKARDVYFFTIGKFFETISLLKATDTSKSTEKSPSVSHARYVTLAKEMLEESRYKISIEEIARAIGFSRKYLSMIFCQTMGITLRDYITQKKIELAKSMLSGGEASLKTIAFQLNYNDYSSFSRAFKKESGLTPYEYLSAQKNKAGE